MAVDIDISALSDKISNLESLITVTNDSLISDDEGSVDSLRTAITMVKDNLESVCNRMKSYNETAKENSGSNVKNLW